MSMMGEFKEFAVKGNVMDLAVGAKVHQLGLWARLCR
jgi:large-conductance mechanosensitive channel